MAKQWYVVQTLSNYEKKAAEALNERIERSDMREKFGEVITPTEEVVEMRAGKKRHTERKFYPGYMLVEMDFDEEAWMLVKNTPRIIGFVGDSSNPVPLEEAEVKKIMDRIALGTTTELPKEVYEVGEEIHVMDGPFKDFSGVVEAVNYEKSRLQVAVTIFGRSTPVELSFEQVEKT